MAQSAMILNASGKPAGKVELSEALFGVTPNQALVHQAVVRQQAGARIGTSDTQTRGDVAGRSGPARCSRSGSGRGRSGTIPSAAC